MNDHRDHHCALRSFFLSLVSIRVELSSIIRPLALNRSTVARVSAAVAAARSYKKKLSFIKIDPIDPWLAWRGVEEFQTRSPASELIEEAYLRY